MQTLDAAKQFHRDFYESRSWNGPTHYLGVPVYKPPTDMWAVQQIISERRPTAIVETGTAFGGSALFYVSIMDLCRIDGIVVTLDLPGTPVHDNGFGGGTYKYVRPSHPKLEYIAGDSSSSDTFEKVMKRVSAFIPSKKFRGMVILDSDHHQDHVASELLLWEQFVSPGQYLIVEDTRLDQPDWMGSERADYAGSGPGAAVTWFLRGNKRFVVDRKVQPCLTFHPGGYLKCVK